MSTSRTREKADGELFKSTGIDDNATSTKVTVSNTGIAVTGGIQASDSINTSAAGVSKWYAPSNSGNPEFYLGASDAERLGIQTIFDGGTQNLNSVSFFTQTASGASNKGLMNFSVDGTTRLQINDAGLAVTGGVALGGTGVANTISDYETGTFTATLTAVNPPSSPPTATGEYVKVGNICHFTIFRFDAANTTGASAQMKITGLPFTCSKSTNISAPFTHGFDFNTGRNQFFELNNGNTILHAYESVSGSAWTDWNITAGTGKYMVVSGSYITS
tara:strand:- start:295 stop:1119 length:825 start_codon:yes stop_codon:yes gene_type:complete